MVVSVAPLSSASGAADYYSNDNYYSIEEQTEHSAWGGEVTKALGLEGAVKAEAFEAILAGGLPNGDTIASKDGKHAPGLDLTFSVPKSVSLALFIGGDTRIWAVQRAAVQKTMAWAETNLAQGRLQEGGRSVAVNTGKLAWAMFEHDTSRALDPQLHHHIVVANVTQRPDGKFVALHNGQLFHKSALLGSIYHAQLRAGLEKLGYEVDRPGKHGSFEIKGVARTAIDAFSKRRAEILAKAEKLGVSSPKALEQVALRTRDAKAGQMPSPEAIRSQWRDEAKALGIDLSGLVEQAKAARPERSLLDRLKEVGEALLARFSWAAKPDPDPLLRGLETAKRGPDLAAGYAVASAMRHLTERQAVFTRGDLIKAALDFQQRGALVQHVDARMAQLERAGELLTDGRRGINMAMTTRDMARVEADIIRLAKEGQGASLPILPSGEADDRLQQASLDIRGFELAPEQLAAARAISSGSDQIVLVQGGPGSGKSAMIAALGAVSQGEERIVLGLAPQNKMVGDLKRDAGIEVRTLAGFLKSHGGGDQKSAGNLALKGAVLILDEASMVSNRQMLKLFEIGQAQDLARLVLIGDTGQIPAIEAGRPFALLQEEGLKTLHLTQNQRQQDPEIRIALEMARSGDPRDALELLGARVKEGDAPVDAAAKAWLGLSSEERERTIVLTSGHANRDAAIAQIREGLLARGELGKEAHHLRILENLNLTREQMRYVANYQPNLYLEVHVRDKQLARGTYRILAVDERRGIVSVRDAHKSYIFRPEKLSPDGSGHSLSERGEIDIRTGDRLAWTASDPKRGISKSDMVVVKSITGEAITLEGKDGMVHTLKPHDPMRERLTHGVALNMHMAQGITCEDAIAVMDSKERFLSSQTLFNVLMSRERQSLQLFVDDRQKLADRLEANPGINAAAADVIRQHWTDGLDRIDTRTGEVLETPKVDAKGFEAKLSKIADTVGPRPERQWAKASEKLPVKDIDRSLDRDMDFGL